MADRATPNLPSRNFDVTSQFYARLGFTEGWRSGDWMILTRDGLTLEFFLHEKLKPTESWFSCCLRLDDVDAFYAVCVGAGITEDRRSIPRIGAPDGEDFRIGTLIDPDGTLLRLIQN